MQIIKEVNAPYIVNPTDEAIQRETVIIQKNGEPVAAVVPFAEYTRLRAFEHAENYIAFQQGYADYVRLHSALLQTHPGSWVAILDGQVADSDVNHWTLAERVYRRFGYRPIYMTQVADEPIRVVDMGGPRLVPGETRPPPPVWEEGEMLEILSSTQSFK